MRKFLDIFRAKKSPDAAKEKDSISGILTTHLHDRKNTTISNLARYEAAIQASVQRSHKQLKALDAHGFAMDGVDMDAMDASIQATKYASASGGFIPIHQLEWYGAQGFIGWQMCAIMAQNWLIDKACTMPAKDAVRHGWEITINNGDDVDVEVLDKIKKADKAFKIKKQCIEFIRMGRIFGIRHALFLVDGIDYELPFNPDGVKPGSYKGISQIDPYWITPEFDLRDGADPSSINFYNPTWWRINGKRVHRSHFVIMRNGDDVADLLKPAYFYGGIPTPQKIYERVYAAERVANEAPLLAMSKRMTVINLDITKAVSNPDVFDAKMRYWQELQNNFGIKVAGEEDKIAQYDTNLTGLDETIMTQYQLVAAGADVPSTKLLGTAPKGFNSTGEYDEASYHESLESIQENELSELLDRHHLLVARSVFGDPSMHIEANWLPVDSPTAKEQAEINSIKAATDKVLADAGAVDGFDIRGRIINDRDSGYNGIPAIVPDGPGDREAQQESEGALEQPVTGKVTEREDVGGGE